MELNKINTSFPRQVHPHCPSELSLSPGFVSYNARDTTPEVVNSTTLNSSLASDIETIISSENGTDRSPSSSTATSSAAIETSPTSDFTPSFYHYTSQPRPDQRQNTRMNFTQGAALDRRTHPIMAAFLPRSSESSNWRSLSTDIMDRTALSSSTTSSSSTATLDLRHPFSQPPQTTAQYAPYGWTVAPPPVHSFPRTTATSPHGGSTGSSTPLTAHRHDPGDIQNQEFYGYGFDRGDGKVTLLVPVDMLPPVAGIPKTLNDRSGIIMLTPPSRRGPGGLSSDPGPLLFRNSPVANGAGDQLQQHAANIRRSRPQSQIDSIVASSSSSSSGAPPKRTKIYCDKWIHEGVCAFTQQGCKFKHEMPMDKATQHDLGLFQGLPSWWKKHQAELQRQNRQTEVSDAPICLTRSRETSPPGRGIHRERHDIGAALTPPHSAVSGSDSSDSSPTGATIGISNRNGNPTIPSARRVEDIRGLNGSRHNEPVAVTPWHRIGELASHLPSPSPYGAIGSPRKPGREMNAGNPSEWNRYSTLGQHEPVGSTNGDSDGGSRLI